MVEGGLTPHEGLAAATAGSACALGLNEVGTIEAGKAADLVALNSDLTTDVSVFTRPDEIWMVIFSGSIVAGPQSAPVVRGESIAAGM